MKTSAFLAAATASLANASSLGFRFRLIGGNDITNNAGLRQNGSVAGEWHEYAVPGPWNPDDHWQFGSTTYDYPLGSSNDSATVLNVPTWPNPGGATYWWMTPVDGDDDIYEFMINRTLNTNFKLQYDATSNKTLLRYNDVPDGTWKWIAKKSIHWQGLEAWQPMWVRCTEASDATLATWEYVDVDVEMQIWDFSAPSVYGSATEP